MIALYIVAGIILYLGIGLAITVSAEVEDKDVQVSALAWPILMVAFVLSFPFYRGRK